MTYGIRPNRSPANETTSDVYMNIYIYICVCVCLLLLFRFVMFAVIDNIMAWWSYSFKIEPILSITSHAIYGAVSIQLIHLSYDDCENMCTLAYHHQIGSMTHSLLFSIRSWKNGMRCMSVYIHIYIVFSEYITAFESYKCSQISKARQTRFTGV